MTIFLSGLTKISDTVLDSYSETVSYTSPSLLSQYQYLDFELNILSNAVILTGFYSNLNEIQLRIYDSAEARTSDLREYTSYESENLDINGLIAQREIKNGAYNLSINYSSKNNLNKIFCRVFNLGQTAQLQLQVKYLKLEEEKNKFLILDDSNSYPFELVPNKVHLILTSSPAELVLPHAGVTSLDFITVRLCKSSSINTSLSSLIPIREFESTYFLTELYKSNEFIYFEDINSWL